MKRRVRVLSAAGICAALAAALLVVPLGTAANAVVDDATTIADPAVGPDTEIRMTGLGPGQDLPGFQPPAQPTPGPVAPYPSGNPSGYAAIFPFAGVISTESIAEPGLTADMYCINLRMTTETGVGYVSGSWDEANVPNIDYVTYILNNYYPTTGAPTNPDLSDDQRAAAVQAAIWYFTDGFIVNTSAATVRAEAAAIVEDARINAPGVEPPAPDVTITAPPGPSSFPVGSTAGPFTVHAEGAATVTVTVTAPDGVTLYADAAGTVVVPSGTAVAPGTQLWVRSSTPVVDQTVLRASAVVPVQSGQVYLYDGSTPGLTDAQRLILASPRNLEAIAEASATFFAVGSLTVNKAFAGDAAGQQEASRLRIECDSGDVFTANIPAGADTTQTFTYDNIAVGATCTVTETVSGETTTVAVDDDGPASATIAEAGASATITNTVSLRPGALNVVKVISGPAAGLQGEIVLSIVCEDVLDETFVLPAGSEAGRYVSTFDELPAGTTCTVTETESGATEQTVVDSADPVTVAIPAGGPVEAAMTNAVDYRLGNLNVVKVLTGASAGLQGEIVLDISCTDGMTDTLFLAAGTPAGEYQHPVPDLVAGTECTITETSNGATTQAIVASDAPVTVTIERGGTVDAVMTNRVTSLIPAVGPVGQGTRLSSTGGFVPTAAIMAGAVTFAAGSVLLLMVYLIRRREASGR